MGITALSSGDWNFVQNNFESKLKIKKPGARDPGFLKLSAKINSQL
jgi:hypothetical protein